MKRWFLHNKDKIQVYFPLFRHEFWTKYVQTVLKNCLKKKIPSLLRAKCLDIQATILTQVYPSEHEEIGLIYEMICGHSNFLETILDDTEPHNVVKAALVRMIVALILKDVSICKTKQIPIFLGAYHGSLSKVLISPI